MRSAGLLERILDLGIDADAGAMVLDVGLDLELGSGIVYRSTN